MLGYGILSWIGAGFSAYLLLLLMLKLISTDPSLVNPETRDFILSDVALVMITLMGPLSWSLIIFANVVVLLDYARHK